MPHHIYDPHPHSLLFSLLLLVFQVNHFAALLIVAFLKANTDWLGSCGEDGCLFDLQQLLWAIFIVRFLFNMREVAGPLMTQRWAYNTRPFKH